MKFRTSTLLILAVVAVLGAIVGCIFTPGEARADRVEPANTSVSRLHVTYVESTLDTDSARQRWYFELNDGSAWVYANYRGCTRDDGVPNRVCRTVFWYAR